MNCGQGGYLPTQEAHVQGAMRSRSVRNEVLILLGLSFGLLLYQILTAALSPYGYFIDEFYYH